MLTIRRFVLYAALSLPVGFFFAVTSRDRRAVYYLAISIWIAFGLTTYLIDRNLRRYVRRYEQWRTKYDATHRRAATVINLLAFTAIMFLGVIAAGIALGLYPFVFYTFVGSVAVWAVAGTVFKKRLHPILHPDFVLMLIGAIYLGVASMIVSARGASSSVCERVEQSAYLHPIITRAMIADRPEVTACFPYDVRSDPAADRLFFTLKQRRSGYFKRWTKQTVAEDAIGATSFQRPDFPTADLVTILSHSTCTYPQRITVDAPRKRIFVVVLDADGAHQVRILDYANGLRETGFMDIDFEPIRVYLDDPRHRIIVVDQEGSLASYDEQTLQLKVHRRVGYAHIMPLLDTLLDVPKRKAYYTASAAGEFLIVSPEFFGTIESRNYRTPVIGLAYDEKRDRLYAAGPMTHEMLVVDARSLSLLKRIDFKMSAREVYIDQKREVLLVTGYNEGYLSILRLSDLERVAQVEVGNLARSVHLEPTTGRVFATSSCGLFEVDVDRMIADRFLEGPR